MAVTNFTPLLGLALPTTGDLSGTWGTTVNTAITDLLDDAVAGTVTLSANADVTLTTTNGADNQARNAVILWTASNGATTRNITAPAQSKAYIVINAGTGSVVIRGSGPTAGVTIPSGTRALVAWNGSDFVKIVSNPVVLTSDVSGILPVANGGTATATPSLVQGANITISGTWPNQTIAAASPGTGTVTSVTASPPLASSGGTTPNISITSSTGSGAVVLATSPTLTTPVLGTPSSGTLSACTVDGTNSVGFRTIPQNAQTTTYTLVLADSGKHIYIAVAQAATTITIPATGTALMRINYDGTTYYVNCSLFS
jgi:hypothetical protein